MRVCFWGTADMGKPRNRILLAALRSAGAEVVVIHQDVWQGVEDKAQLRRRQRFLRYARSAAAYPALLLRFLLARKPDAILLAYPAPIDVLVIWPLARLRGVPVLMDLFISVYDTVVVDRAVSEARSLKARLLWSLEWLACRAADRTIIDTAAHARYIEELYRLPRETVGSVPVGVEPDYFRAQPRARPADRARVLFYGQLIPLQGVGTILDAALSSRGSAYNWTIIGSGQEQDRVAAALGVVPPSHVTWIKWVPYPQLSEWIAGSDICLGIFGTSRKAASVVPNKVYQSLSCGRHVVTRASPAMEAFVAGSDAGVTLVEAGSSEALLDGIEAAIREGCRPPSADLVGRFSSEAIGSLLVGYLQALK